ncbi:MAG: hypothetical protein H7Y42_12300 [Chitinophagaceae bacterium]|nr:hypothetical protein [Chitinophagaceae bacterium]
MTNKEALQAVAQITLSDAAIDKAFLDASSYGLASSGTYSSSNEQAIDFIAYSLLSKFLAADIKEGGYSISYKNSIEKILLRLRDKWGFGVVESEGIKDASFLW